jgi:GxxExxY protein
MNHKGHREHEEISIDNLSHSVIGCAIEVHKALGPGLLESTYQNCLSHELSLQGIQHSCEVPLSVNYRGMEIECGYRVDILVENKLILELKSIKEFNPIYEAQLLTYLKLSGIKTGLLLNFNVIKLKEGIKRFVL